MADGRLQSPLDFPTSNTWRSVFRILCAGLAVFSVVHAVAVLGYVATSPDVGIRCLIADPRPQDSRGISIHGAPESKSALIPKVGDTLLRINREPTRSFLDFVLRLQELRNPPTDTVPPGMSPDDERQLLSGFVGVDDEETRFVEIEFLSAGNGEVTHHYVEVESIPFGTFGMTLFWFACQLGILVVAALAFWSRPFDVSARLFFLLCAVSLGAFVGGFHWWVIAASPWLNVPFIICAVLVPPVSLHFFLTFPRPGPVMLNRGRTAGVVLYAIPAATIVVMLTLYLYAVSLNGAAASDENVGSVVRTFSRLRVAIHSYIAVAGGYFLATLASLIAAFLRTRTPLERNQVKWILWAATVATVPFGYSLWLAMFDPVGLALGKARVPMFLASLLFTVAYALGIVRHKLMWTDDIVSRGALYYVASSGLTAGFATLIALGGVASHFLTMSLSAEQRVSIVAILFLAIVILLWLRDRVQRTIDQRFFREKYRLDRALSRMNRAAAHLVEPEMVAEMMVGTCSDVLQVERVAFYIRSSGRGRFQLAAIEHDSSDMPADLDDTDIVSVLSTGGSLQRIASATRDSMSRAQEIIRELNAELLYPLETDAGIVGIVVLGGKRGKTPFTAEDLTFLNTIAQITTVALHSARANLDMSRLNEELHLRMERIAEQRRQIAILRAELASAQPQRSLGLPHTQVDELRRGIIRGSSPAIQSVLETVRKVASTESTVLIRGESGTGKELIAQVLHDNSQRSDGPMVRVNCAALATDLLESELFGHVRGAFTGAHRDKVGRFEAAHGGTLFLDEIGDVSPETQVKLLRVLQERCFEPVGGTKTIHVDVRLITATNRNLEQLIASGRFREDLFYRLNVISIMIPPLRERHEDLIELAIHFLNRAAARSGKEVSSIEDSAVAALEQYSWPGNVRELENAIERAVVLAEGSAVSVHDLPLEVVENRGIPAPVIVEVEPLPRIAHSATADNDVATVPAVGRPAAGGDERAILEDALVASDGNKAEAARLLGIPRSTFYSRLKKLGIT